MRIVTVPNHSLRTKAKKVSVVDEKLVKFITDLEKTLTRENNPKGVGLAAPQVDKPWRIISTLLSNVDVASRDDNRLPVLRTLINPVIVKRSPQKLTLGPDSGNPTLEGCLSIPKLYGPVPRLPWIEIEYQQLLDDQLVEAKTRFDNFAARVLQHELDHLEGILFTDYAREFNLPVYLENPKTGKLEEIGDKSVLETF